MKLTHLGLAAAGAALLVAAGTASAQSPEELLKKYACTSCHQIDKKVVGPAYKDVAAKYRNDKDAVTKLSEHVKKGGAGVWGQVPMPPHPQVPDADIQAMVKYVLTLK